MMDVTRQLTTNKNSLEATKKTAMISAAATVHTALDTAVAAAQWQTAADKAAILVKKYGDLTQSPLP